MSKMNFYKIPVEFIGGIIFSFLIFAICLVCDLVLKTYIVNASFIGYILPFSNSVGMLVTDKIYFQNKRWNIFGLIIAIIFNPIWWVGYNQVNACIV